MGCVSLPNPFSYQAAPICSPSSPIGLTAPFPAKIESLCIWFPPPEYSSSSFPKLIDHKYTVVYYLDSRPSEVLQNVKVNKVLVHYTLVKS